MESLVGGHGNDPGALQSHRARVQHAVMPWGVCTRWVQSPELLPVLCFVQRKTKPFTQPGKRNLPRLVTNTLQSSSAALICKAHMGTRIPPDFPVPSWAPGFILSLLVTSQKALFCVCSSSPAWHGAAQVAVRKRWLLRKATSAPLMSALSKAGTVMWMLLTVKVRVFHNTWSWWQLRLQHLSWPSCWDGGAEWFCQGRNSLFSKLLVLFLEKTNEVLVLYTFTHSFSRG